MYKDILLPVDLEQESAWRHALPVAVEYAQAFNARLHVLNVVPDFGMSIVGQYFPEGYEQRMAADHNRMLHEFVRQHVPSGVAVQHVIGEGRSIYKTILEIARTIKADLIIMSAHRPELADYVIGSNTAKVVSHADCSVLVVRG